MNINTAEITECIENQFKAVATDTRVRQLQRITEIGERLNELEEMYMQVMEQLDDFELSVDSRTFLRSTLRTINTEIQDLTGELEDYERQEQFKFESEMYGSFSGTIIDPGDPIYKPQGTKGECLAYLTDESLPSWDWIGRVIIDNISDRAPVYTCHDIPHDRIKDLCETIIPKGAQRSTFVQIVKTSDGFKSYGVKYVTYDKVFEAVEELEFPDEEPAIYRKAVM